jgi:restriction endonuclease S subunit
MAVWSVVKKNELEGSTRMDAEYYQPKYLSAHYELARLNVRQLTSFCSYIKKGIFDLSPDNYCEQGIPFVRTTEIKKEIADFDSAVYIPEEVHKKYKKTELQSGDIVFTKIGANIGDSSILPTLYKRYNFSQNVAGAKIKQNEINPYYLAAYLSSKYGKFQLKRVQMLSGQGKLELADIRNMLIFNADEGNQESIAVIYKKTEELVLESKKLYSQAEQILLEELGLKDLDLKDDLFYTTTLKEVKDNNRMDTEYYMPKYEKLMEHIFNFEHIPLGKLAKFKKGVEPGSDKYFKTGKPFLRVSNLSKFEIINNNQKYLENNLYMQLKKSYEPKKGEILLSKDATPGVAYVLKESIEGIISSGILKLEVALSIKNEYLALVINSQVGQMQMKRDSSGSIINHWKIDQIKNLEIPLLTHDTQKKIENLCCESFLKRKEAKQLLEQAKHKVEEMIEKEVGVK